MIGNKIKEFRVQRGMTQKSLADLLFVSPQAVSRWENNEVEPSIGTITELARIFNVTTDEILGVDTPPPEPTVVERVVTEKEYVYKEAPPQVLAVCDSCKKRIIDPEDIARRFGNGGALCTECKLAEDARKEQEIQAYGSRKVRLSYIWGGITAAVFLIIGLALISHFGLTSLWVGLGLAVGGFTLVSCLILDNNMIMSVVEAVVKWGFVKMPGIIFTMDFDGCLFYIGMKILFAVVGFVLGFLATVAAILIGMVFSIFVYPFALRKRIVDPSYEGDWY